MIAALLIAAALQIPAQEIVALGQVTPMGTGKVSLIRPKIVLAD